MDGAPCWAGHQALCWTHAGCPQVGSVQSPRDSEEKVQLALRSTPRSDLTAHTLRTTHFTASKDFMSFLALHVPGILLPRTGSQAALCPQPASTKHCHPAACSWLTKGTDNKCQESSGSFPGGVGDRSLSLSRSGKSHNLPSTCLM